MTIRRTALAAVAVGALALTACADSTPEWESEQHRQDTFAEYMCDTGQDASQAMVTSEAAQWANSNTDGDDRMKAMDILQYQSGSTSIDTEPRTVTPDDDGNCHGWVWDHYLQAKKGQSAYDDFTAERAAELGYL